MTSAKWWHGLKRRVRDLYWSARPDPLVFSHVPKAGGTSIEQVLQRKIWPKFERNLRFEAVTQAHGYARAMQLRLVEGDSFAWMGMINAALCYKLAERAPFISGHFAVNADLVRAARPPYRFVTLLRDPADRWISHYIYGRLRALQKGERPLNLDLRQELEQFLESRRARIEGAKYVLYFAGYRAPERLLEPETRQEAVEALELYDAIGFLDDLPAFERDLGRLLRTRIRIPHLRKTEEYAQPGGPTLADFKRLFGPEERRRVRELCAPDYAIYHHFARRLKSGGTAGAEVSRSSSRSPEAFARPADGA